MMTPIPFWKWKILMDRDYPGGINFGGNRALKQSHGYYDSVVAFKTLQDTLESVKNTVGDSHSLPDPDVRPRLGGDTGTHQLAKGSDFGFINRNRNSANAHDGNNPRRF